MEYYGSINTKIGVLEIKSDGSLITDIYFTEKNEFQENLCHVIELCKKQLEEYFEGKRFSFEIPIQFEGIEFRKKIWNELLNISYGTTITYLELAKKTGDVKAVRAVGLANGKNRLAIVVPCHRVIGANNKLVGYAGGLWRKKWLLEHEIKYNTNKTTLF